MIKKRFTIYQKNSTKPIILTAEDDTAIEEVKKQIHNIFKSKNIFVLDTDTDCLIGRPSEIQSVLVSLVKDEEKTDKGA